MELYKLFQEYNLKTEDWFDYMGRCKLCKYIGKLSDMETIAKGFSKKFYVCPSCGENRVLGEKIGNRRQQISCITSYAVHKVCGKYHLPNVLCSER